MGSISLLMLYRCIPARGGGSPGLEEYHIKKVAYLDLALLVYIATLTGIAPGDQERLEGLALLCGQYSFEIDAFIAVTCGIIVDTL